MKGKAVYPTFSLQAAEQGQDEGCLVLGLCLFGSACLFAEQCLLLLCRAACLCRGHGRHRHHLHLPLLVYCQGGSEHLQGRSSCVQVRCGHGQHLRCGLRGEHGDGHHAKVARHRAAIHVHELPVQEDAPLDARSLLGKEK